MFMQKSNIGVQLLIYCVIFRIANKTNTIQLHFLVLLEIAINYLLSNEVICL